VAARICGWFWWGPVRQYPGIGLIDFNLQRETGGGVAGMFRAAVAAGAGGKCTQQIDFGKEFKEITGAYRACFHKILMGVMGETRAHEHIQDIMDMGLGQLQG